MSRNNMHPDLALYAMTGGFNVGTNQSWESGGGTYQVISTLDELALQAIKSAAIEEGFCHLLKLRASQINQCAFCVRLHTRDALAVASLPDRISVLPAWHETQYFTDKERAAFELLEAITLSSEGQVPDSVYAQAVEVLSSEEIVAIEWLSVVINAWNRIATPSRYPVKA